MKIRELIELLEGYDDDLEVRIASQPSWPFENSISGVVSRYDYEPEAYCKVREAHSPSEAEDYGGQWFIIGEEGEVEAAFETYDEAVEEAGRGEKENCVFIAEGRQICYGSKNVWDCV